MQQWRALSRRARGVILGGGVFVAVFVVIGGLNSLGAAPSGPSLSSYATTDDGLAALESLLARSEHPTTQLRLSLDEASLTADQTVIAVGQVFSGREQRALRAFVRSGGRLITGGPESERFLTSLDTRLQWATGGSDRLTVSAEVPTVSGVRLVRGDGFGSWQNAPGAVLLRGGDDDVAFEVALGRGVVVALADPSVLTNDWLAAADNAGFAVGIAGAPGRQVVFAENGHGFGAASGFGALPARWKAALWFAAVAAVVGALAAGKRFGPVDVAPESTPPERVQYVGAVASTLSRARDRDAAIAPLRDRAAMLLARRAGGSIEDPSGLMAAAQRSGLSEADARSLVDPVINDDDLLRLGRAVSRLEEH